MLIAENCKPGHEQYEFYESPFPKGGMRCQYDYRDHDGELFTGIFNTLDEARLKRDKWLRKKRGE